MAKSSKSKNATPLMKQYNAIKVKHPNALLLFRVGDFYETFGEDAIKTAKLLDIVLTKRGAGSTSETELAGFPHHALNTYLPKLVKAGERVAICDQLEDPKLTKTIVKRGVTELITPGVSLNDEVLQSKTNNFLAAVYFGKSFFGISFLDVSTGEFLTSQGDKEYIAKLLQNFKPSEILIAKNDRKAFVDIFGKAFYTFYLEDWIFQTDYANETLLKHFGTVSLKGFSIQELYEGIIASGAILHYLKDTQHHKLQHITTIKRIAEDAYVWMDQFTIKNLELYSGTSSTAKTLLDVIDYTISPMGGRALKRWLALPLKDLTKITHRHKAVAYLKNTPEQLLKLQHSLKQIGDLERLVSKVATAKISPHELIHLKNSLEAIIPMRALLLETGNETLQYYGQHLNNCDAVRARIKQTLNEDAPISILKGNTIAQGFSEELDELRGLAKSSKSHLNDMLTRETARTKIPSLKISSNNVFGYYIEVRNSHKDKVPSDWVRKQTLVNAERYITDELKAFETKILGAEERIMGIEQQLFSELVLWLSAYIKPIQSNAQYIGQLDVLCGFAQLASQQNYTRPELNEGYELEIIDGRHPVIEQQLSHGESYVTNSLFLDRDAQQLVMITGPNMSGKSAILRQTALIVLLAQMGSFVPAKSAKIGLIDKLFTRVGASDNISMGESTFMVEMNETASILNNITPRSLILLDEIGRGTSTYDGISIAWAISEYLHEHPARPKTLFATHYHELNQMTETFNRIKNYNVSVKTLKDNVLFLRKLVKGGSRHSFGIHVAKMAGMPQHVIQRANKILERLEKSHSNEELQDTIKTIDSSKMQLSFFNLDDPLLESIRDEILHINIDNLTPVEALMKLNDIKRMLEKRQKA